MILGSFQIEYRHDSMCSGCSQFHFVRPAEIMTRLDTLQKTYGNPNHLVFEQLENGMVLAKIDNALVTATVSLYGGQIVEWQPKHQAAPVLWRSSLAHFKPGKAIRAGVPLCWPWFGAHPTDPTATKHGYARISPWEITSVSTTISGATEIMMTMQETDVNHIDSKFPARLGIRLTVADALSIELTTTNLGAQSLTFTEGLHAYLHVSDIANVQVNGLNGCEYVDSARGNVRKQQSGPVRFTGEVDQIYLNTTADCVLEDPGLNRKIKISKSGSLSTVVWNPWLELATKMDDLGPEQWQTMACVESMNALDNVVTLPAGMTHTLHATYSVENI